jgi:hypothetical protein
MILKMLGLLILIFCWPNFNTIGIIFNNNKNNTTLKFDTLNLCAYFNTILGLTSAVICSLALSIK